MATATKAGVVFDVSKVKPLETKVEKQKMKEAVETLVASKVEACDNYTADVLRHPGYHSLMAAANYAYSYHYPLVLSPSAIWITIAQGLANHINNNAEELRHCFVTHEGKEKIEVRRDNFVRRSPENPWAEVFGEFSFKLKEKMLGDTHGLIVTDFSTSTPTDRAASEVVLMDAMKSYFDYYVCTACGIPSVALEGTKEDWEKIVSRVEKFTAYGLDWWVKTLRANL